ncbi:MAG: GNAT family N-acetyltransferase [Sphingobacteriales bacterium]|nr:GNAT family N-acetyltransferase [Sphingobacteriales bacterium]
MIAFKPANADDWAVIRHIAYTTWPDTFGHIITADQLDYMLNLIYNEESIRSQMSEKGHHYLLATLQEDPIGFVSYEIHFNSQPQLMIHKFYLLPEFQGVGIGTKALNLLSEIARKNGDKLLRLKVYYKNAKAIGFYERYGFRNAGSEETNIGNNYNILDNVMVKEV